jgi:drug/metabolite transporter (DMT)-like permease
MACGLIGVGAMSGLSPGSLALDRADLLILASAIAIGLEVVVLGRLVSRGDPTRIALVTVAVTALIAAVLASASGERAPSASLRLTSIVVAFGIATAYIQFAMSWGQRFVSSSRAAMIYSLEPVFGGLIGHAAGEVLSASDLVGGALIVSGVLVASLPRRVLTSLFATDRRVRFRFAVGIPSRPASRNVVAGE